ncbi:MAG: DEAD/DEAH box helicase [Spirochaetales bacterium]|nr:DEAD/DEAH box helicase [Spirochaetales bacterium]
MKFTELGLQEATLAGVSQAGFQECTNVQSMVLPISLTGKDVMVQSKTGSGKTAIFVLTIIEKYIKALNAGLSLPVALIVAPTRELAVQIEKDAKLLSSQVPGFKVGCFYGGVGYVHQSEEIASGLSLYVGTPGRLIDFANSGNKDFRQFTTVVLDEADRMFDMGFYPDIQKMFSMMLRPSERQTMLLSATLSTKVRNLAWEYMNSPEEIESQPEEITVKKITQELFHVTKDEKFSVLLRLLKHINPESCLIFCNTKGKTVEVSKRLVANGYKCAFLMGDMAQSERLKTLDRMKAGQLRFLVATDVAARGLQIDDLALVVNYDIPEDFESYVHRIGRTARAGKSGKAITLACEEYIYGLEAIENYIQMKIPVLWIDDLDIPMVEDKSADMVFSRRPAKLTTSDRRGGRRPSRGSSEHERRRPAPRTEKRRDEEVEKLPKRRSNADYSKLSRMSVEERMKLYRKEYEKEGGAKRSQERKNQSKRPVKPMAQISSAPNQMSITPKKKSNLWSRFKALFGKKEEK